MGEARWILFPLLLQNQHCRRLPDSKLLFLASPRKSNQKKGDPSAPLLRGSLDISQTSGAAQLALRAQTVLA
jgi:hypothetical protein